MHHFFLLLKGRHSLQRSFFSKGQLFEQQMIHSYYINMQGLFAGNNQFFNVNMVIRYNMDHIQTTFH